MVVCIMKGVAHDEHTENFHHTLQFLSALPNILASLNSLFWFHWPALVQRSHHPCIQQQQQQFFFSIYV